MQHVNLGFWLANLLLPGDPHQLTVQTPAGAWQLHRHQNYAAHKAAITQNGQCGQTYAIEISLQCSGSRAAVEDQLLDELLSLCLAASYLTGLSVAPAGQTGGSDAAFLQVGPHFPRVRAMGEGHPICPSSAAFATTLGQFVAAWTGPAAAEKPRLLIHHWLDALAFWSIEDLVLSTGTILEVIAATAESLALATGPSLGTFNARLAHAASRFALPPLPSDFRLMRNDLVHEGVLSGSKFSGKDAVACGQAAAEVLDWIDRYIFAAFGLGTPPTSRFAVHGFQGANSFSL